MRRAYTRYAIGCKYKWEFKKTECRFIFRKMLCENEWGRSWNNEEDKMKGT
jgi:hypothetical protein